jgi:trypsin-like peptidase
MFPRDTLRRMRWSVCALGVSPPTFSQEVQGGGFPKSKIFGTGFIIRDDAVLTARHVVYDLRNFLETKAPSGSSHWLDFVHPAGDAMVSWHVAWQKTTIVENEDLAIVGMPKATSSPGRVHAPLPFTDPLPIEVGQEIGIYGFPFGSALMRRESDSMKPEEEEDGPYRVGPVLQQGHIAAIAPYSDGTLVERLLLDVRTWFGMSGAPVFDPHSSTVIGIHQRGRETVTAFALPLTQARVAVLLAGHDQSKHWDPVRIDLAAARRVRDFALGEGP